MKKFLRLLARISQQSGQNCLLDPLLKNCLEICLEKNPSSIVSRTLRWKFLDFRQSFIMVVKTAFQMFGGKLWGLFQTKDVILAKSEKWANFFLEFSLSFFSLSKLLHSSRSEKNNVEKGLFFQKTCFFSIISNILSEISGPSTNFFHQGCQTCPFNVQTNFA